MTSTSEYYKDKVAVVTGAASGIGLALAEAMLSYGAKKVVLADFNDENLGTGDGAAGHSLSRQDARAPLRRHQ